MLFRRTRKLTAADKKVRKDQVVEELLAQITTTDSDGRVVIDHSQATRRDVADRANRELAFIETMKAERR